MDYVELGNALRRVRQDKGLRIKDLQDENISISTISNIERGIESVKDEVREYYCRKLGIDPSMIPELIRGEQEQRKKIENQLMLVESRIDLGLDKEAKTKLKELFIRHNGSFPAHFHYLKGRYYYEKRNHQKAKKHFEEAIKLVDEDRKLKLSNIKPACLKDLGRISFYYERNINKALEYVNEGLKSFDPDGERKQIKYYLLIGRVLYLEKLDQKDDALESLNELWQHFSDIRQLEIKLNMLEMRASLLNSKKRYEAALPFAIEGFKIATSNQKYGRAVELLTTWGTIAKNMKNYDEAENCYLMALELENKIDKKYLMISTYTKLGKLYTEIEEWDKAQSALELAVHKGAKSNDVVRYCQALVALGEYFMEREQNHDAIKILDKAYSVGTKHRLENLNKKILINLSECWERIGNTEKSLAIMSKLRVYLQARGD